MAERLQDAEDRKLESLFRSEPVPDGGFSVGVISRVRRRIWVRRLSLPAAFVIGGVFAANPIMQLSTVLSKFVDFGSQSIVNNLDLPMAGTIQQPTIILGILLLGATLMIVRMLED